MKCYSSSKHEVPSAWQTQGITQSQEAALTFLQVNGLKVKHVGHGREDKAASVRANCLVPADLVLYYFEIVVVNKGEKCNIGIGFAADVAEFPFGKLPGWSRDSYGYHGDDGNAFCGGKGVAYAPTFTTGDTIGALLNRAERTISFFKNGIDLGVAFRDIPHSRLFPTLGMLTRDEEIEANFGAKPFKVDVEMLQREYMSQLLGTISRLPLPSKSTADTESGAEGASSSGKGQGHGGGTALLLRMVFDYLVHHRCIHTAELLARDMQLGASKEVPQTSITWEPDLEADVRSRAEIYEAIVKGDIDSALRLVKERYQAQGLDPLEADVKLSFRLRVQKFVEMVGSGDEGALDYGRAELAGVREQGLGQEEEELLADALSLLAYEQPEASPCGQLLRPAHRQVLAEQVNSALLRSCGRPAHCGLERTYQQAVTCLAELRAAGNVAANVLDVHQTCLQGVGPRPGRALPDRSPSAVGTLSKAAETAEQGAARAEGSLDSVGDEFREVAVLREMLEMPTRMMGM